MAQTLAHTAKQPVAAAHSNAYLAIAEQIDRKNQGVARQLLEAASKAYYELGGSPMTDEEYDTCLVRYKAAFGVEFKVPRKLAEPETKWPVVAAKGGPKATLQRTDRQVGSDQDYPFLANFIDQDLRNPEDLRKWWARTATAESSALASPKYDGMGLVITYDRNGTVVRATTRGDDGQGVDVTRIFEGESHFEPIGDTDGGGHIFDMADQFGLKYEVIMSWSDVTRLSEATGKTYKNPRNTVAGILSSDDSRQKRGYVVLAPLDIEYRGMSGDRLKRVEFMDEHVMPFFVANNLRDAPVETPWDWMVCPGLDEAEKYYHQVHALRSNEGYDYMLDGIVLELHSEADIQRLGGRSQEPGWVAKMKFPYLTAQTKAVSVDFDVGNTGRVTPVVNFEPVVLNGNTYSRTSIANFTRFDELALCPGTPLTFELRGDVIGWLDRVGDDPEGAEPFAEPEGVDFTYNDEGKRVFGEVEAPLEGRVERMLVKLGVKGVREQQITKLVKAGAIRKLTDVWKLSAGKVAAVDGFGKQQAAIVCEALDVRAQKGLKDWEVLASLGAGGVGRTISKLALGAVTLVELYGAAVSEVTEVGGGVQYGDLLLTESQADVVEKLSAVPNLGAGRAIMILSAASKYAEDMAEMVAAHAVAQTKGAAAPALAPGQALKMVVTGELKGFGREEFKELVEGMGHKLAGSMSRKVDFLITNDPNSGTSKNREARELGIPILTEEEALERLGIPAPAPRAARGAAGPPQEIGLEDV